MGIGHTHHTNHANRTRKKAYQNQQQISFTKNNWQHALNHGGTLRQKRKGRKARPLSTKDPIHLVLKADKLSLRRKNGLFVGLRSPLAFLIINSVIKKYSKRFFVKIEQISINHDHIHILIRISKRSLAQHFLRVAAGQIAQQFKNNGFMTNEASGLMGVSTNVGVGAGATDTRIVTDTRGSKSVEKGAAARARKSRRKLWKYRPFTRIVKGWRAYNIVRDYIQLNEKEATGQIAYKKERLRGLTIFEWQQLWST